MVSPVRGDHRRFQAETPLIALFKFAEPALLLQGDDGAVWSVPPQWTDLAGLDPAVVMGDGRAVLRAIDLMELASLVKRLSDRSATRQSSKM
jgi:hypothetical protein